MFEGNQKAPEEGTLQQQRHPIINWSIEKLELFT